MQKQILIKQAQTHFNSIINTRKWNSQYGGVFVKPQKGQTANPYLHDNTLYVDENLTLIRINSAWMTRQLSELATMKDFHFRIASLNPLNPNNQPNDFEKKALELFAATKKREYYEINKNSDFNYMAALETTPDCLQCHPVGYKVGDIQGGISIRLDSSEFWEVSSTMKQHALLVAMVIAIFLFIMLWLIRKQLQTNEILQDRVERRTQEIASTKELLQVAMDADSSLLMMVDNLDIIFVNKALLSFFHVDSLETFKTKYGYISSTFEMVDDPDYITQYVNGEHWLSYLQNKEGQDTKVMIKRDNQAYHFRVYAQKSRSTDKSLMTIIFDDITSQQKQISKLQEKASKDPLTGLFNRRSFDEVITQEIKLANTIGSSISLIFIDIDFFKKINDTHGHDVGDSVLKELALILSSQTRKQDIVSRWGGEEFVIALQSTTAMQASLLAEKIRTHVSEHHFTIIDHLTISLGVTQYRADESKDSFIKRADQALYQAKHQGRDQVVVN